MANQRNLETFMLTALLALGGLALPLSASALEGEVRLYGSLHPFVDNFRTTGATPEGLSPDNGGATQVIDQDYTGDNLPNRWRMTSSTSHIGFRSELRLMEGLRAFFQVEAMVNIDGDAPVLTNPWASRNSGIGVTGDYGTLFFGNWDTPYKYPTLFVGPVRSLNPFDNTLTGNPGFNVPGTTTQNGRASTRSDAAFNRRQGNSVQYWTPTLYGLSARLAISSNEGRTVANEGIEPSINPTLWSALLSYNRGSLSINYAYEMHLDYFGVSWLGGGPGALRDNPTSRDDAHQILAWYTLPTGTRLAAIVERLTYRTDEAEDNTGVVNGYQRDAFFAAVQQRLGAHRLWGSFGLAGAGRCTVVGGGACTTNGLNGLQWSVGYTFSPAETFDIYASYYEMRNGRSATYGLFPFVVPVEPGTTTRAFGLGILYMFDVSLGFFGGPNEPPEATQPPAAPPEPPTAAPPAEAPAPEPPAPEPA
ncbi:MAG: porin [Deltaproteobacteria bacterium]|nr:porin [Deltaproteobacteria bacterium]